MKPYENSLIILESSHDEMNKAIFLDRDGTINVEKHYLYRKEDFEFIDGVPQALKAFREKGYLLILVTNQSGIARGYYSLADMEKLHEYMQSELMKYNVQFDDIFYCPHYSDAVLREYRIDCDCRKPKTGMFERAIKKYDIDIHSSYAIGDRERDLIPAEKLGAKCILLSTRVSERWMVCENLMEAARYIVYQKESVKL